MLRIALLRAPFGPLSEMVFLQSVHEHWLGLHRRPALKQSQYNAMHLLLGQEQPFGLSWSSPISRVAEQSMSSLSNPFGLLGLAKLGWFCGDS